MAEGGAAKLPVSLDETHKEPEECAICYTEFKDPRFLDCSHRFCLKCLQEFKQTQNTKTIICPICRRETIVPEDRLDMLPKISKVTSQGQCVKEVRCQACNEGNEAISQCMDCEHYLCQECHKAHKRMVNMMHKIVMLTESTLKDTDTIQLEDYVPNCQKHPDEDIRLYCKSWDVFICNKCTTFEHKSSMHTHCSIDEAFSKCSKEINEQMSQTRKYVEEFNSTKPMIDHARNRLHKMLLKTKIQISLKAEKEIAKIRQKEEQLKQEAQRIAMKRDKEFALAGLPEETLNKVNKVMTTASKYEIIKSKMKIVHDLQENVEVHKSLNINYEKSFLGFKESDDSKELGTLLKEEKWAEKKNTQVQGKCVAMYSTREILVVGKDRLTILDPEAKVLSKKSYKPQKGTKESEQSIDIQNPTAAAINKDDKLIILDASEVKIFNREYQLLNQFTPGKKSDKPTCLAVDDSNLIAVGYKDKEEISLHNPDGSLIRTLSAPMVDQHLTISNQRLIYTSGSKRKLMAIDYNGKILFNVTIKDHPGGMCCDGAGDIYVSHYNLIFHYRADGKVINQWYNQTLYVDLIYTPDGALVGMPDYSPFMSIFQNV